MSTATLANPSPSPHAQERARQAPIEAHPSLTITLSEGQVVPLDLGLMKHQVEQACADLHGVDAKSLVDDTLRNLYDSIPENDVLSALVMTARGRIEQELDYSAVTARLLLEQLRLEASHALELPLQASLAEVYPGALAVYIEAGIRHELLDPELASFDLPRLGDALKPERDLQLGFLGLQTLYDRYFIHWNGHRLELPQVFFMRVAMGLALREDDPNARAIEFYNLLSSFDYMASTPTLFNSGTRHSQLSSCYLTTVGDDLGSIYSAIKDNALLSKWAGGLGNDWTPVRALGAHIKGTNGKSQGVVPFLKVVNDLKYFDGSVQQIDAYLMTSRRCTPPPLHPSGSDPRLFGRIPHRTIPLRRQPTSAHRGSGRALPRGKKRLTLAGRTGHHAQGEELFRDSGD